ncbi:MAG: hypothetical protein E7677_00385 [Ruminococcaceae bacterium]|nr:hypothetical protein [Oscillospiraceae bacterium]
MRNKKTLMRRRVTAIIAAAIAVAVLAVALALIINNVVNVTPVTDKADGTVYYIIKRDGVYALYDTDKKTLMPRESHYKYYEGRSGTLFNLNAETGECEQIVLATLIEGSNESFDDSYPRLLIFPHVEKENIFKIEVVNSHGSFTFKRVNEETLEDDSKGSFIIEGSPFTSYDQDLFASLYVSAGYSLTSRKIDDPIKHPETGDFREYGLVPEMRKKADPETGEYLTNEDGSFIYEEYTPSYYVLTDTSGKRYKLIIGDKLVTGGGYYAQYVDVDANGNETKRDAVYVLGTTIADTLLAPVEDLVTPEITYPMTANNYFDVENFILMSKNDKNEYDTVAAFTYEDMSMRENTIKSSEPYYFLSGYGLAGFKASADNIEVCLRGLYSPAYVEVTKLAPSMDDLAKYGIAVSAVDENGKTTYEMLPEHTVSFNFDIVDGNGKKESTINNIIYISALNEDGNRYVYSEIYKTDENGTPMLDHKDGLVRSCNMIVEIEGHSLEFLNWDRYDWINANYVSLNIAFCDEIILDAPNYKAVFDLTNPKDTSTEAISSSLLTVHATDSTGKEVNTFATRSYVDVNGNVWVVSVSDVKCYSSTGEELKISANSTYYDYNVMGTQVRVLNGAIECADGRRVYVSADEVKVEGAKTVTYVRYDTNLFRQFYKTLLYATISDSYEMTPEEETAVVTEQNRMLTLTVKDTEGTTYVYSFYYLTSRKAYITVSVDTGDGISETNGGFYVLNARVEKFISDAQRFFALEMIDATAKN